jgi:hopanoid biosynthesis associated RND transporter like protein HpnN
MSAEGTPQGAGSPLERVLVQITRLVLRFPVSTLILGVVLACAALGYSQQRLGFRTNRLDLLNPKSQFNKLWTEYIREFGDQQDAVVVVEGADRARVVAARDDVANAVNRQPKLFTSVFSGIDPASLRAKGLYYLNVDQLQQVAEFVDQMEPALRGQWSRLSVGAMAQGLLGQPAADDGVGAERSAAQSKAHLERFLASLELGMQGRYRSPFPEIRFPDQAGESPDAAQLLLDDGRMGFVLLKLAKSEQDNVDFVRGSRQVESLRDTIAQVQARHPEAKIGLTGIPIIEYDEMSSSQSSMSTVSVVSFVGVWLLFVAGFGGWRHPLLAVTSLTIGTGWAMGYITGVVGHLNILSSAFAVILIGQGIDFSMYYVAEYLQLCQTARSPREALVRTVATVGPGVATGAVTTAVAFFMAGLTDFVGVAELGIIAGGGILLCWIAGLTVLPAMIHLVDSKWPYRHAHKVVDVRSWIEPLLRRPLSLLAVTSLLTVVVGCGVSRLWYDYNLLHLQAKGLESVDLEQRLLSECDQNSSFAISIAGNVEELFARKSQFERLPSVKRVEELVSRLPDQTERKRPIIADLHRQLADLPQRAPQIPVSPNDLGRIDQIASRLGSGRDATPELRRRLAGIADCLLTLSERECLARLSEFQQAMANDILTRLHAIADAAGPRPPEWSDFPESLVSRFVSPQGRYLMKVYSREAIWDMEGMKRFVADVRSVDPRATGNPLQVYEASRQMQQSYYEAAFYALAIILPVVFLDFRSIRFTALALLPLGIGIVLMFGLMGWLNIPFNPANMIVLPLILGIGIDAGVHVVHDYISQTGPYRINGSTASAVVINTVTNIAGFGSLMIASHRGLQSLGRVLTLGLTTCLFASLIMLPALLTLLSRRRAAMQQSTGQGDQSDFDPDAPADTQPLYRVDEYESPMRNHPVPGGAAPRDDRGRSPQAA